MLPKTHFLATLTLTIITLLFNLTTPLQAAAILFGGLLIDTDHYLLYVAEKKDWSLRRAYKLFYAMYLRHEKRKSLYLFHTVEFFLVVLALGFVHPIFFYIFAGMIFHLMLDITQAVQRGYYAKSISIIGDLYKHGSK